MTYSDTICYGEQGGSVRQLDTSEVARRTVVLLNFEGHLDSTRDSFVNLQLPNVVSVSTNCESCMSTNIGEALGVMS